MDIATGDAAMADEDKSPTDDDKPPTDGRDSGIGQSAASSIPSIVIDHLSSGTPSRVQSGLVKSPDLGMRLCID